MSATRLKTGRGKHKVMLVTVGSPTLGGSGSSATGQYITAGAYCKVETDGSGGLQFANITNHRTTPTSGDNGYILETIIFNFNADTMTDKWANSLTYAQVVTDVVPTVELEDGYGYDSSVGMSLGYFEAGEPTSDTLSLLISADAIEILAVRAILETKGGNVGQIQVYIDDNECMTSTLTPATTLGTGTMGTATSILGTAGDMLILELAGTWTGSADLSVTIDYRYL